MKRKIKSILVSAVVMSLLAFCFNASFVYAKTVRSVQASSSAGSRAQSSGKKKTSAAGGQAAAAVQEAPLNVVFLGDSN